MSLIQRVSLSKIEDLDPTSSCRRIDQDPERNRVLNHKGETVLPPKDAPFYFDNDRSFHVRLARYSQHSPVEIDGDLLLSPEANIGGNICPSRTKHPCPVRAQPIMRIQSRNESWHTSPALTTYKSRGKLFYRLMEQAVAIEPVTGHQIRGASRNHYNHNI